MLLKKTQRYNEEDAIAALTAIDGPERGELPWNAASNFQLYYFPNILFPILLASSNRIMYY